MNIKNLEVMIDELGNTKFQNDFSIIQGENLQTKIIFKFKNNQFIDGSARVEWTDGNKTNVIYDITKLETTYEMEVTSEILANQKVYMQLVITEGTDTQVIPIFKTKIFCIKIDRSINAIIGDVDLYKDFIDIANVKLNQFDNISITAENVVGGVKINITDKNGDTTSTILRYGSSDGGEVIAGIQDVLVNGVSVVNGDVAEITMLTSNDISTAISTHNSDTTTHSDMRTEISTKVDASDVSTSISTHNSDTTSHSDIRQAISSIDTTTPVTNHNLDNSSHADIRQAIANIDTSTGISTHNSSEDAHSYLQGLINSKASSSDISSAISTHDSDSSAHSDIRTTLNGKASASDISTAIFTHNSSSDSHSDIRGLISNKASTSDINSAISNHDVDTSAHEDIRTSISSITPSIQTTLNGTCNANTKYYLGEVSTLNLTLPDEPSINDEIYISFYNPTSTATIISINDFYNGSIDNTEGYHCEIDLLYDGTIWNVAYIEQEVL